MIHGGAAARRARQAQDGLARGADHHRAGRYPEAARAYAEALQADPKSVDARALLGGVMLRLGRPAEAQTLLRGAVSLDPNHAVAQTNLGRALLAVARFEEAELCFLAALQVRQGLVEARLGLARARRARGDLAAAEAELRGVLGILERGAPSYAEAMALLGATLLDAERPAEAERALRDALQARPNDARLLRDLGGARLGLADPEGAAGLWADAAALDPTLDGLNSQRAELARTIGLRHLAAGEPAALEWLRASVRLDPDSHAARLGLCDTLFQTEFVTDSPPSAELERDLSLLLHAEGIDHQRLERAIRHLLGAVPGVASALDGGPLAVALAAHPLFAPWLTRTIVTHPKWWALIARIHGWLLTQKVAGEEVPVAALEALEIHAWNTEYAAGGDSAGVVERVSCEATHAEERRLGAELSSLGALVDATSLAVRDQYEAHPYPRLVGIHRREPCSFAAYVARAVGRSVALPPSPPRVLVAGGGTGQHPIGVASALADSDVVCIDLSTASLGRAARLAREGGSANIRFIQGDLLSLAGPAGVTLGVFGFIDCVGVLHHLADPLAGGRALVGRLAPGGVMRLSVYSERGRAEIVAAQSLVAEHGWLPTDEGLREARSALLGLPASHPAARVTASPDFYTQSGLRDLVFHACEHRYTPSQLADLVRKLGMEVLGLQHARPEGPRLYRERWPEDPSMATLERWDDLERVHPRLFSGMIHVWLRGQKAAV